MNVATWESEEAMEKGRKLSNEKNEDAGRPTMESLEKLGVKATTVINGAS